MASHWHTINPKAIPDLVFSCLSNSIRHTGHLWIFTQAKLISISGSLYLLFTLPGMLFLKNFTWWL